MFLQNFEKIGKLLRIVMAMHSNASITARKRTSKYKCALLLLAFVISFSESFSLKSFKLTLKMSNFLAVTSTETNNQAINTKLKNEVFKCSAVLGSVLSRVCRFSVR